MIQKRYQYYSRGGIVWSPWMDYCDDDSQLEALLEEFKWQLKNKLKNEFRNGVSKVMVTSIHN